MDHEPCGELNPADAAWLTNSAAAWATLFPHVPPPAYGSHSLGPCCCCADQKIAEDKRIKEEAERRRAAAATARQREAEAKAAAEAERQRARE
eukprot:1677154-Pleurochrysis_carterae.AAC.1